MKEAFEHIDNPGYRALLVFPSHNRALSYVAYAMPWDGDVTFNRSRMELKFPSGATIRLGVVEHSTDVQRYAGLEFQFVGFMGHFDEEDRQWLMARCRSNNPELPARVM